MDRGFLENIRIVEPRHFTNADNLKRVGLRETTDATIVVAAAAITLRIRIMGSAGQHRWVTAASDVHSGC